MALHTYTPELGQRKPAHEGTARLSHFGKHYFVRTTLELKGRGIELQETIDGVHKYKCTERAFDKICGAHDIVMKTLLD